MSIVRINIDQQYAQIGIRNASGQARMQISMPKGQMTIRTETPRMELDNRMPTFQSPRQRISNESGLMSPLTLARDFRNKGKQAALRAAGEYKNDGNFIANHRIPGDKSIPMLAKRKMDALLGTREFNVGLMPSSPPSLDWDKGYTRINWSGHSINVDWTGGTMADVTADTNYPVEVSLSRQPSFRISSIEPNIQTRTYGRYIDRMI